MKNGMLLWLPVLGGLAVSFALSSRPGSELSNPFPDYVAHAVEYLLLGLLVVRAFNGGMSPRPSLRTFVWSVLFCLLWAIGDEYHQSFVPGREPSVQDVLSDLAGSAGACPLFAGLRQWAPPWA